MIWLHISHSQDYESQPAHAKLERFLSLPRGSQGIAY